jgi:ABC-2 type transport system permease protein
MAFIGGVGIVIASSLSQGTMLAESWPLTAVAYLLAAVTFAAIGLMLGSVMPGSRAAQGLGLILFFVMLLISGSGPPRDVLAGGMREFSSILPLTHVTLLLQETWLFGEWEVLSSLVLAGFLVVAAVVTVRFFRWE